MNNQNLIEQIKEWIKALFKKKGQVNTNCPPNYVFNPVTNICEPIQTEPVCPTGFTYNPTTGLCESDVVEEPEPPTYPDEPTGTCPIGYSFNDVSRFCENSAGEKVLPEGWIFDEETQLPIKPIYNYNFPENAYFLAPNESGHYTKEMVENAVNAGNKYIVFDTQRLDIQYDQSPQPISYLKQRCYLYLTNLKATEAEPIVFDFRKCFINCIPSLDPIIKYEGHRVMEFVNCENITIKTWRVDGDKFKREFLTNADGNTENTMFVRVGEGTKNLTLDGGFIRGFMGDVSAVNVLGPNIDAFPESKQFHLQPDGRYESVFYNVNSVAYKEFGLTGGLGYNRLLYYDMEDITYKMFDANNVLLGEINGAKYFQRNTFIEGTKKIKVNVRPMDGRIENPTNFGHRLVHNPSQGITVKGVDIFDHHRGGLANLGALATIEDCEFYNTTIYNETQKFGNIGTQSSTTYHINCEDAVARNLVIRNCEFKNKFHKILLTHNISATIQNNKFKGSGNNLYVYDLLSGEVTNNEFESKEIVSLGNGTNLGAVKVYNNTGSPNAQLSQGAEWYSNIFNGGGLLGQGKCHGNIFNNFYFGYLKFTKDITNNVFNGYSGVQYMISESYIFENNFNDIGLSFAHGTHTDKPFIMDGCTLNNENNPSLIMLSRGASSLPLYFVRNTFISPKIHSVITNRSITFIDGVWSFEDCDFINIQNYFIKTGRNFDNPNPVIFNFKNCTFQGSGLFVTFEHTIKNYEVNFDNCTIDPNITLPTNHSFVSIPDLVLVEPRTMPIPTITKYEGWTKISAGFHHMTLKIRDKRTNDIILDKIVTKNYQHHYEDDLEGATAFEYSIDGGKYWD